MVRAIGGPAGYRPGGALGTQAARHFPEHGWRYSAAPQSTRCCQPLPGGFTGPVGRTDAGTGCAAGDGTIICIALSCYLFVRAALSMLCQSGMVERAGRL